MPTPLEIFGDSVRELCRLKRSLTGKACRTQWVPPHLHWRDRARRTQHRINGNILALAQALGVAPCEAVLLF